MFRMYVIQSHSYTRLILALGIVREPTECVFITSRYPGTPDVGLAGAGAAGGGVSRGDVAHAWRRAPAAAGRGAGRACPAPAPPTASQG